MTDFSTQAKNTSLREWMLADDALEPTSHPLIRLGALYHLDDHNDDETVISKIRVLLDVAEENLGLSKHEQEYLFYLHAAVHLANKGDFDGVKRIIRTLLDSSDENKKLAQIALASCYRFPLAPLIAQVLDLGVMKKKDISLIEEVTGYSEDNFIDWAQKTSAEQESLFDDFRLQLNSIKKINRKSGMEIGLGYILKRPAHYETGYTYSGFISAESLDKVKWIAPYSLSNVINKDNALLKQDVLQMQGYTGRRVIIVYQVQETYQIKYVYVLPFAILSSEQQEIHLMHSILEASGAELAIVHSKWSTEKRERYRLISARGTTSVHSFMSNKQRRGNVFIIHEDNYRPLNTKYYVSNPNISKIVSAFAENTGLGFAVNVARVSGTKRSFNLLLSADGNHWKQPGENQPPNALYAIEHAPWGLSPFVLADDYPSPDRIAIMSKFFANSPDNYGVVASNFTGRDGHLLARVVTGTGKTVLRPVDNEIELGIPIFHRTWIDESTSERREKDEIIFLTRFTVTGACKSCHGVGYELCTTCQGEASTTCSLCKGAGDVPCSVCYGTQRCNICGGSGYYSDTGKTCVKCGGSGLCRYCQKRRGRVRCKGGCDYGRVKCPTCSGNRTNECKCGGKRRGRFVEL